MAAVLGVNPKTTSAWGRGVSKVPKMAVIIINQMLKDKERGTDECLAHMFVKGS